jgi:hypothetical protein
MNTFKNYSLFILLFFVFVGKSNACSIAPTETVSREWGTEAIAKKDDYVINGKVLGNEFRQVDQNSSIKINTLKIQVISSENEKAHPGEILYFFTYVTTDSSCHIKPKDIDAKSYPIKSQVRIINRTLAIPEWDLKVRLIRVNN